MTDPPQSGRHDERDGHGPEHQETDDGPLQEVRHDERHAVPEHGGADAEPGAERVRPEAPQDRR
eukprot:2588818-Alexandrium_andersonii.AAC.1